MEKGVGQSKSSEGRRKTQINEEGPSLQVVEGGSQEQRMNGKEEGSKEDMGDVMRRLFNEGEASIKI